MSRATVPPYRDAIAFSRSKACCTRTVQSSGSSFSAIVVEPAMSANRIVSGRRSLVAARCGLTAGPPSRIARMLGRG
jgi:hypothetical protein